MAHPDVQEPDAGEDEGVDLIRDCNRRDEGRLRPAQQELLTANRRADARRPPAKLGGSSVLSSLRWSSQRLRYT
jgi:hypothetical protein